MKKIIAVAALAVVAACSQAETEAEPAATEEVVEEAEVLAADGQSPVGSYKITTEDGEVYTEVLSADGTYTSTAPDGTVETGKWNQQAPETYCTTKDEEGATEKCSTEQIDENGVWTSVNEEGETVTVERIEVSAAEAAE